MQARFLSKVVDNYETMKAQSTMLKAPPQPAGNEHSQVAPATNTANPVNGSAYLTRKTSPEHDPEAMDLESGVIEETCIPSEMESFAFSDTEMWEKMFAEAGFRLNDGVFTPEAMGT